MRPLIDKGGIPAIPCIAILFLFSACQNSNESPSHSHHADLTGSLEHVIKANHPSLQAEGPLELMLVQQLDSNGWSDGFSIEIDSVICRDVQCEIIPVGIQFDAIGNFREFQLQFGDELTKMDHIPFTDEDYSKLREILSNPNSALRNISADRIVTPEEAMARKEVDGISGATSLTEEEAIVEGAAYTSYTLWHWANNPDIRNQARLLTAQLPSEDQLIQFLNQGTEDYLNFAINQLIANNHFGEKVRFAVSSQLGPGKDRMVKPVMKYLEAATAATGDPLYFQFVMDAFHNLDDQARVRMLESMGETSLQAPDGFMDSISKWLPKLRTYYEVHLLLELLDSKNQGSPVIQEQACRLLAHENFLIARRSFWFLEEKQLNPAQKEMVDAFKSQYQNRL
jgi:hypothetical protein